MRIAVLNKDKCQPRQCSKECYKYCPRVRTGDETILFGEDDGKAIITESLCSGCGICVKKCQFDAIMIIGLPESLEYPTHRYGQNGFALYGLPVPQQGKVTGILGPNGIGKSTAVQILSGALIPNFGEEETSWGKVLEHYSGTALGDYFKLASSGNLKVSQKPQYVDLIPKAFKGKTSDLLNKANTSGRLEDVIEKLEMKDIMDRDIGALSGGELQKVAIAACIVKEADFYFFDEISSYLDIYQRINAARLIQDLAKELNKSVMVVEHDLAILDMLADTVHIAYGTPAGYGVMTMPKSVRVGINQYIKGYLPEENIRIRDEAIRFETHPPKDGADVRTILSYDSFTKKFGDAFSLEAKGGSVKEGEVLGIVGPNGTGKSTFVKILAGEIEPDTGEVGIDVKISYKPQYIKADAEIRVRDLLMEVADKFGTGYYETEIARPLRLDKLYDSYLTDLSGGELQRVAIAACLSREADFYILDEPSAHLDVEQRAIATRVITRFAESNSKTAMVVDHDIYMIDMISQRLIVFEGEPSKSGLANAPTNMKNGMNKFLSNLDITFRRDEETKRPRVNNNMSRLDREQKEKGEYYYSEE
ncbi:ribosome biogenesis/translation initiation ATPase RLI [Methanimicrococcus blatticola]|uniref:Translation initiation factor RLI1 n=1 Tax=Methanimicrococcus blatticola TaxID=91560 RepID=A0A484F6D0_9EURY|nr:ribosome biogenesis/translation initiation ATPase RLI [Methanimicrococcus blatticola]MBZ3935162.1 ribosome biogenesis/translation initiation ATPase RLI [Methanimicrococcus blatticola]MCC2508741.1 ribosome biogenesis/translation initiation ATPase RLI [Methanimicrococcus blatticola]TDQ71224.1 translation initiation factor RLI1 [Methanimicrococcus blatticola]